MVKTINFQLSSRFIYAFIALFCLFQLLIAMGLELSYDEAYYWLYSQNLNFGYFDHPPMVAWGIKLGNLLLPRSEMGTRFFSQLSLIGTIVILWKLTGHIKNKILFLFLLFMFPLIGLTGLFALPDAGLMLFATLYFYLLKKYLEDKTVVNSIFLALSISLMFYSKYHGLLVVLLTVIALPKLIKEKTFWLTAFLVIVLYLPHLYWQYQHDFLTFKFHLTGRREKHFSISNIADYVFGQWLLMGFLNFLIFLKNIRLKKIQDPFKRVLWFNSYGFLVFLFIMSFRNQIEANWTITAAISLFILSSYYADQLTKYLWWFSIPSFFFLFLTRLPLIVPKDFLEFNPSDNRINEIVGWKNDRIPELLLVCGGRTLVGDNYQITSKIAFYLEKPNIPALHLGSRESEYTLLNLQKNIKKDQRVCFFTSKTKDKNAVKIETNFKDPIYVSPNTSLEEIAKLYETTYEEIIRERKI